MSAYMQGRHLLSDIFTTKYAVYQLCSQRFYSRFGANPQITSDTRMSCVNFLWLLKYAIPACGRIDSGVVTSFMSRVYHNKNNILHCSSSVGTTVRIMCRQLENNAITMIYALKLLVDLCNLYSHNVLPANSLHKLPCNRDCRWGWHMWHCASSLWCCWYATNLDTILARAFKLPTCAVLTVAQSP